MASSAKLSACDRVMANANLPNAFFSFLEPGEENAKAAQVCKKWQKHAEMQYTLQDRLNLNWLSSYLSGVQRNTVTYHVLTRCVNLKQIKLPEYLPERWKAAKYDVIFFNLPKKLREIDFSPASPLPLYDFNISKTPTIEKLSVSEPGLLSVSIDKIADNFPGLKELEVTGELNLVALLNKTALRSLYVFLPIRMSLLTYSNAEMCATLPERPSVRSIVVDNPEISDDLVKFLISKLPNLERLELRNGVVVGERRFLNTMLRPRAHRETYLSLAMDSTQLIAARAKLKP